MTEIIELNDEVFEDTIKTFGVALVDFYADWCQPCKNMESVLEKVAEETNFRVVKVNIEKNPITPAGFNVNAIPALFLFKDGNNIASRIGTFTKTDILNWIREETRKRE